MVEKEDDDLQSSPGVKMFTRCSPIRIYSMVKILDEDMKDLVKAMGFGTLLGMKKCSLRRDLIAWLIDRFDPIKGSLEIHGQKFDLGSTVFGKMLGVTDGGEHLHEDPTFEEKNSGDNNVANRISLNDLKTKVEKKEEREFFVRNFIMYVVGALLMPSTSVNIVRSMEESLKGLNDARKVRNKNWASMSWRFLVESVRRYKEKPTQFVSGCVLFFQLFYFHEAKGYDRYVDRELCPTNWWSEAEINAVLRWIKNAGGYGTVLNGTSQLKSGGNDIKLSENANLEATNHLANEVEEKKSQLDTMREHLKEYIQVEMSRHADEMMSTVKSWLSNGLEVKQGCGGKENDDSAQEKITGKEGNSDEMREATDKIEEDYSKRSLYERYIYSGCKVVGPFRLKSAMGVSSFSLANHIFDRTLRLSDIIFRVKGYDVLRYHFRCLEPEGRIDAQLLSAYALCMRCEEGLKWRAGMRYCCVALPMRQKNGKLLNTAMFQQEDDDIPSHVYDKVIVPILDTDTDHWLMAEIIIKEQVCKIWDSMWCAREKVRRFSLMRDLLGIVHKDIGRKKWVFDGNAIPMNEYRVESVVGLPQQSNDSDCGLFVMKFMHSAITGLDHCPQFNLLEERLKIAIDLITNVFNEKRSDVVSEAQLCFLDKWKSGGEFKRQKLGEESKTKP